MSAPSRHPWQFANRVLPEAFLADPNRVVTTLSGAGGSAWVAARWAEAARDLPAGERLSDPPGFTFEPSEATRWKLVVVRLPAAAVAGEPAFAVLCLRPARARLLVFAAAWKARYFVLEHTETGHRLREWTEGGTSALRGDVAGASRGALVDAVARLLS